MIKREQAVPATLVLNYAEASKCRQYKEGQAQYCNKIHQRALVTPVLMWSASVALELSGSASSGSERDSLGEEASFMEWDLCMSSKVRSESAGWRSILDVYVAKQ